MFLKPSKTWKFGGDPGSGGEVAPGACRARLNVEKLTLALFVPPVAAQNADRSLASDHLAVSATTFYGCSYFHIFVPAPDGLTPTGLLKPVGDPATG